MYKHKWVKREHLCFHFNPLAREFKMLQSEELRDLVELLAKCASFELHHYAVLLHCNFWSVIAKVTFSTLENFLCS